MSFDKRAERELAEAPPSLVQIDFADVMTATLPEQAYVLKPLIPCGHVTLGGGHGGAGKSVLALTWAARNAARQQWEGIEFEAERR